MEFNRLLSQAISFYGEPGSKDFNEKNLVKKNNKIKDLLSSIISNTPDYDFESFDKSIHKLWCVSDKSFIKLSLTSGDINLSLSEILGKEELTGVVHPLGRLSIFPCFAISEKS